jgi:hypothetical protein
MIVYEPGRFLEDKSMTLQWHFLKTPQRRLVEFDHPNGPARQSFIVRAEPSRTREFSHSLPLWLLFTLCH